MLTASITKTVLLMMIDLVFFTSPLHDKRATIFYFGPTAVLGELSQDAFTAVGYSHPRKIILVTPCHLHLNKAGGNNVLE